MMNGLQNLIRLFFSKGLVCLLLASHLIIFTNSKAFSLSPRIDFSKLLIGINIYFQANSSIILPQSYDILDEVAKRVKYDKNSLSLVIIEGHSGAQGSEAQNQKISEKRAEAGELYLIEKGIPRNMLKTIGYGSSRPVATSDTPEGRARNRRVEFKVHAKWRL